MEIPEDSIDGDRKDADEPAEAGAVRQPGKRQVAKRDCLEPVPGAEGGRRGAHLTRAPRLRVAVLLLGAGGPVGGRTGGLGR